MWHKRVGVAPRTTPLFAQERMIMKKQEFDKFLMEVIEIMVELQPQDLVELPVQNCAGDQGVER